ncbi:hypothetical protein MKW94_014272 [Papaver nudicaule]|uniref:Cadmium-induced protein AS8 n=1 Tax=Papaver nudicaule TaxID=74823 RepID=A0AA41UYV9_PAPNU|nr:hypothetical protein [Papaver nudicaule]
MVMMIIKGLFRRYERWNPVHPTTGAFWGPGFGPEVIGYVGAGCGIGFSVGITLAGVGIGLPANFLLESPYKALVATTGLVRSNTLPAMRNMTVDGWNQIQPQIAGFQRDMTGRLDSFSHQDSASRDFGLTEMRRKMICQAGSVLEGLGAFRKRCLPGHKGT